MCHQCEIVVGEYHTMTRLTLRIIWKSLKNSFWCCNTTLIKISTGLITYYTIYNLQFTHKTIQRIFKKKILKWVKCYIQNHIGISCSKSKLQWGLFILTNVLTNGGICPDILTNAWVGEFGPHCICMAVSPAFKNQRFLTSREWSLFYMKSTN